MFDLFEKLNSKGCGNQSICRLGSIIKAFNLPNHQISKTRTINLIMVSLPPKKFKVFSNLF